jgi:formylmethanofuran dehydrogenase subunit B
MTATKLFPVVCAGCPCLCDDIGIAVQDGHIVAETNACQRGAAFLAGLRQGPIRSWIQGKEVPVEVALQAAAVRLAAAVMPGILGLSESSLEAITAAVALVKTLHGIIAPWPSDPTRTWGQQAPDLARSWAEIKTCDLLLCWRADPLRVQPRLLDRLTVRGSRPRLVVVTDGRQDNLTAAIADHVLRFPDTEDLSVLRNLRFHVEKQGPLQGPAAALAQRLFAAQRCHIFLGKETATEEVVTDQCHLLAAHLLKKVRISISPLAESVHVRGVTEALTWLTSFPGPVSFALGEPQYRPGVWEAERLLTHGLVDVALCLGPCPAGKCVRICMDRQEHPEAEIAFHVPGLSPLLDAHVMRPDGIMLRLAGIEVAAPDPVVGLLQQLQWAVQEIGS